MVCIIISSKKRVNYGDIKDLQIVIIDKVAYFYIDNVLLFKIETFDYDNIIKTAVHLFGDNLSDKEYFLKGFEEVIDRYLKRNGKRIVDISYVNSEKIKDMLIDLENNEQFKEVMDLHKRLIEEC